MMETRTSSRRSQLPRWKKLVYGLLTCAIALVLLEALLAAIGVQQLAKIDDPFVGFDGVSLFVQTESDSQSLMRTRQQKLASFNDQQFVTPKPADTIRIFCLGGSTTYGRPFNDSTSYCGQLRKLLQFAAPKQAIEVINAGGISYASYRLTRICREVLQYSPDALVVYTGHNEFLEQRTYEPLKRMAPWRRASTRWLSNTRLYSGLHQWAYGRPQPSTLDQETSTMLDQVVGPEAYQRDDELRQQVAEHFRWNLDKLREAAQHADIPLILITPAANLADISPFKSQWTAGEDAASSKQARSHLTTAKMTRDTALVDAIAQLKQALEFDPRYADTHYELGQALLRWGKSAQADEHFQQALEEDVCPLRANQNLVNSVRLAGSRSSSVTTIDFEAMLRSDCQKRHDHTSVGSDYFLDHVHPTPHWHGKLAVAIAESLSDLQVVDIPVPALHRAAPEMERWAAAQLTPEVEGVGLRNLAKVLNWAGKHREAGKLAIQAAAILPDDGESHLLAAPYLHETGRHDAALIHARRAAELRPDLPATHRLLGQLLAESGDWSQAAASFQQWTELEPDDDEPWRMLGSVEFQRHRWHVSLSHLQHAAALGATGFDLDFQTAATLHRIGELDAAERRYRQLLISNDGNVDVLFNLALLLSETKRNSEAMRLLEQLLELKPDEQAANLLARLRSQT